ncbi:N-6 DNA methylase [Nocardia brasiliensis]|uniref:class I SAM-dependent DNA methyltransferase n=1 Tax=Nocardia brasiliensis TaxID=37326 RepID=UPI003791C9C9
MPADSLQEALDFPYEEPKKPMYRTRAEIASAIKSARDVMRKDAGLNGDLDRLPQLSWLLFLRAFSIRSDEFGAYEDDYEPALDGKYRWEHWGSDEDFTGPDFLEFVNNDLLPHLRDLEGTETRNVIARIFKDVNNRMLSGTLLRDLVNIVDRIDFHADETMHTMAFVYESIMKEMRDAAGDSGEFYTPRPVIEFMVQQSFLELGESILDPACGTGGFLVAAFEVLKPRVDNSAKRKELRDNIHGIEKKPLPYLLCMMNLLLHDVDAPRVVPDNALIRMRNENSPKDRVKVVLTNPPFGGEEEKSVAERFPKGIATRETAWLFVYSVIEKLEPGGRCAIVLPNGSLFETRNSAKLIKEKLMKECDLHTIVRLPQGVFAPYTQIPANLLFFEKGRRTKETWFYEVPTPEGRRGYSKTKPMQFEEFADCADWWGGKERIGREPNERAWKVHAKEITDNGYNLDLSNPHGGDDLAHRPPVELVEELLKTEKEIVGLLEEIQKELGHA